MCGVDRWRVTNRLLVALALASCSVPSVSQVTSRLDAQPADVDRARTAAALLDPRCWKLAWTRDGTLDTAVPDGHTWYVGNALAVHYGEPIIYAQDDSPGARASGFVRDLSVRHTLLLPSGTRVRNSAFRGSPPYAIQLAYVWYCDPATVIAADPRYTDDPAGLLAAREAAIRTLPRQQVILEVTGGGSVGAGLRAPLPCTGAGVLVVYADAYDVSWITIGASLQSPDIGPPPLNTGWEISNAHRRRASWPDTLMPMACGGGIELNVQKANAGDQPYSDSDGLTPGGTWSDPPVFPIHGSAEVMIIALPEGW